MLGNMRKNGRDFFWRKMRRNTRRTVIDDLRPRLFRAILRQYQFTGLSLVHASGVLLAVPSSIPILPSNVCICSVLPGLSKVVASYEIR